MADIKKLNAFTLAELLVVLVISALVIALTMVVNNLVQKQMALINSNTEIRNNIQSLARVLWQDSNQHDLFYDAQQAQVHCISPKDTIIYQFEEGYVLRNTDTLSVAISATQPYLAGKSVHSGRIDALELTLLIGTTEQTLFVFQPKDVAYYMNQDGL